MKGTAYKAKKMITTCARGDIDEAASDDASWENRLDL